MDPTNKDVQPIAPAPDFQAMHQAASTAGHLPVDALGKRELEHFEKLRDEIHRLVIYALRFGAVLLGAMISVRFWHLGAPDCLRWLSETEVQSMDKMLFSSAFGGFVFGYIRDALLKGRSFPMR